MLYDPVTKFTTHPCLGSWIWEVGKDILIWTEPLYHFFGLDPSDKPPLLEHQAQLYTPESFSALHDAVSKCLKTGEPYTLQLDGIHSSGRTVRLEVYGVAETDGSGKVVKLFGQVIDRTESHKAQTELQLINQQFSLAFENAPIGKAIVSLDGKLLRVNRAFAEMLGYSPEEMEKLSFQAITCEDDLAADLNGAKFRRFWDESLRRFFCGASCPSDDEVWLKGDSFLGGVF